MLQVILTDKKQNDTNVSDVQSCLLLFPSWQSIINPAMQNAVTPYNNTHVIFTPSQVSDLDDETGSPTEEFKGFAGDSGMNRSQSEYCNVGSKTYLTNHPAKKYVFDFMRMLIMDNLCTTPATKQTPVLDLLLEVREGGVLPG